MYSLSCLLFIATSVIGLWTMTVFKEGQSYPVGHDPQCGGLGSGSAPCENKTDSELAEIFKSKNRGKANLYLQKFVIGNETVYAGSVTDIQNGCVDEWRMDYDSQRFPQYLIHSSCKKSTKCTTALESLQVLNLTSVELCQEGSNQPPVFLSICLESS